MVLMDGCDARRGCKRRSVLTGNVVRSSFSLSVRKIRQKKEKEKKKIICRSLRVFHFTFVSLLRRRAQINFFSFFFFLNVVPWLLLAAWSGG